MKVFVYYNLHKKCWSVKSLEGSTKGKVISHTDQIVLKDATFKVSQAGRNRVLKEQRKNVHAGVIGYTTTVYNALNIKEIRVTYNPYKYDSFVNMDDETPIFNANNVLMIDRKVFAV